MAASTDQPKHAAQYAAALDAQDELREYRSQFHIPTRVDNETGKAEACLYFVGNSLGLQHRDVEASVLRELAKWRDDAVEGHFSGSNPWFEIDDLLRSDMAKVVGAHHDEVVLMNTLTMNLHLLFVPFYRPTPQRHRILIEQNPFPSDMYAVRSQIRLHGFDPDESLIEVAPREGESCIHPDDIIGAINEYGDSLALVFLAGVQFITGQLFDLAGITKAAHARGAMVGFDLAHAVGNVPLNLHDWDVDFACWCTYKYLNGGPGNIGGAFVHSKHDLAERHKFEGWWGHRRSNRFALKKDFEPSPGAAALQLSNPVVLGCVSLQPSLRLFGEIGMDRLRQKSLRLTGYLEELLVEQVAGDVEIITPRDKDRRGSQLSLRLLRSPPQDELLQVLQRMNVYQSGTEGGGLFATVVERRLHQRGIFVDKRPPDVIRVAPVPLYNSFEDVRRFVLALRDLLRELHHGAK
eukprot:TRINITY_DN16571_c0_g1_i1.p1 TRINITY_DN16571_c0_g1~~TRINITY_DN16571_c0_g1_i1.p1  ORF type:complete len:482 (-),score=110.42 TRINITY_DN16571_c0_g1_i1:105-1496(-)